MRMLVSIATNTLDHLLRDVDRVKNERFNKQAARRADKIVDTDKQKEFHYRETETRLNASNAFYHSVPILLLKGKKNVSLSR